MQWEGVSPRGRAGRDTPCHTREQAGRGARGPSRPRASCPPGLRAHLPEARQLALPRGLSIFMETPGPCRGRDMVRSPRWGVQRAWQERQARAPRPAALRNGPRLYIFRDKMEERWFSSRESPAGPGSLQAALCAVTELPAGQELPTRSGSGCSWVMSVMVKLSSGSGPSVRCPFPAVSLVAIPTGALPGPPVAGRGPSHAGPSVTLVLVTVANMSAGLRVPGLPGARRRTSWGRPSAGLVRRWPPGGQGTLQTPAGSGPTRWAAPGDSGLSLCSVRRPRVLCLALSWSPRARSTVHWAVWRATLHTGLPVVAEA